MFSQTVKDDRVTVAEGTFDATGIAEGWADLVVIAQVCGFSFINCLYSKLFHRPSIGVPTTMQLLRSSLASSNPTAPSPLPGI